jgi:P pilus assembly chaperone PapD
MGLELSCRSRTEEFKMKGKLLKTAILMLPLLSLIILSSPVFALGVGVTPGRLNFDVSPGSTASQTLNIVNQSDAEARIKVYPDNGFEDWFTVSPAEFILNAHKAENIQITVSPPSKAKQDVLNTTIFVIAMPPESNLQLGTGIKVAANVQIIPSTLIKVEWWIMGAGILLVLILGLLVWRKYRKLNEY